jgi:hypothetical protein
MQQFLQIINILVALKHRQTIIQWIWTNVSWLREVKAISNSSIRFILLRLVFKSFNQTLSTLNQSNILSWLLNFRQQSFTIDTGVTEFL